MSPEMILKPETQTPQHKPLVPKNKKMLLFQALIVFISFLIGFTFNSYQQDQKTSPPLEEQTNACLTPTPAPIVTPQPTPRPRSVEIKYNPLKTNWKYMTDGSCSVKIPMPPNTPEFINFREGDQPWDEEGAFNWTWQFNGASSAPNILLPYAAVNNLATESVSLSYDQDRGGDMEKILGIFIDCIENTSNLDNSQLKKEIEKSFKEWNTHFDHSGWVTPDKQTITSITESKQWGYPTLNINLDDYYENKGYEPQTIQSSGTVFATPSYIYQVQIYGSSPILDYITDNIVFE